MYGQVKSWIDGGLEPRAVTRDLDWELMSRLKVPKEKNYTCGLMPYWIYLIQKRMGRYVKEKRGTVLERSRH
jgi:hypothetical protein